MNFIIIFYVIISRLLMSEKKFFWLKVKSIVYFVDTKANLIIISKRKLFNTFNFFYNSKLLSISMVFAKVIR